MVAVKYKRSHELSEEFMTQNRRSEDNRMERLEKQITTIADSVHKIEIKIYDGYDTSIKNTAKDVKRIDEDNQRDHERLNNKLDRLSAKMDQMLWKLVGIAFFGIITFLIAHILDWM